MSTYTPKADEIEREWHVVDADGLVLGRLATEVASILRGKHKPIFTPHLDTGDHVVVINADKVVLTGEKTENKKVYDELLLEIDKDPQSLIYKYGLIKLLITEGFYATAHAFFNEYLKTDKGELKKEYKGFFNTLYSQKSKKDGLGK